MFLLFCIPGLPFARHHLFFAFKEVERQSEVGCMLGFHWLPEAAVCTAFVWVSSQLLSNLRMQDHVRSRHLKRMYFFSMTCNVVCSGEISLKMFGKTVFTFWYIAGLYGFLLINVFLGGWVLIQGMHSFWYSWNANNKCLRSQGLILH